MKIGFFGAARTVTGSRHLVELDGLTVLLDCGLSQGRREESNRLNRTFQFDASRVDLVLLSHAHIDHSGNLPRLYREGFRGDIVCTEATRDLAAIMLRDSAHIQEQDIEYLNRKRERDRLPPLEPLYTTEDAEKCLALFTGTSYGKTRALAPGVSVTFRDAGHILGSAFIELAVEKNGGGRPLRLVFSGDLGRRHRPIIRDPERCAGADVLIVESTYGDRLHEKKETGSERLRQVVNEAYRQGGKVIVPSFAVGRTQELVYALHELIHDKQIPDDLTVYVDSPLASEATNVYRRHPETWDAETGSFLKTIGSGDPFGFPRMRFTRTREESIRLNDLKGPAVIISASGMAENGRIVHHLKNNLGDARNTVLFVGFQAAHTLGRRISEGAKTVRIFGLEYEVKARVEKIDGLSAHADRDEILAWLDGFEKKPKQTFVVHGEEKSALAFGETLKSRGYPGVSVPAPDETKKVSLP